MNRRVTLINVTVVAACIAGACQWTYAGTLYSEDFSSIPTGVFTTGTGTTEWRNLSTGATYSISRDSTTDDPNGTSNYLYSDSAANFNFIRSPGFSGGTIKQANGDITLKVGFELAGATQGYLSIFLWNGVPTTYQGATAGTGGYEIDMNSITNANTGLFQVGRRNGLDASNGGFATVAKDPKTDTVNIVSGQYYTVSLTVKADGTLVAELDGTNVDKHTVGGTTTYLNSLVLTTPADLAPLTDFGSVIIDFRRGAGTDPVQGFRVTDIAVTQSAVPEPASLSVLVAGSALLMRRRRA